METSYLGVAEDLPEVVVEVSGLIVLQGEDVPKWLLISHKQEDPLQ